MFGVKMLSYQDVSSETVSSHQVYAHWRVSSVIETN
jgi:hypothetical protein